MKVPGCKVGVGRWPGKVDRREEVVGLRLRAAGEPPSYLDLTPPRPRRSEQRLSVALRGSALANLVVVPCASCCVTSVLPAGPGSCPRASFSLDRSQPRANFMARDKRGARAGVGEPPRAPTRGELPRAVPAPSRRLRCALTLSPLLPLAAVCPSEE